MIPPRWRAPLLPFDSAYFDVPFDIFADNYYQITLRCRELVNRMHCVRHLSKGGVIKRNVY